MLKGEYTFRQSSPFTPTSTFYDKGFNDEKTKKPRLSPKLNDTDFKKMTYGKSPTLNVKDLRFDETAYNANQIYELATQKKKGTH